MDTTTKTLKSFVWEEFNDDPQNQRVTFIDNEREEVLTLYYQSVAWMKTAPYNPK